MKKNVNFKKETFNKMLDIVERNPEADITTLLSNAEIKELYASSRLNASERKYFNMALENVINGHSYKECFDSLQFIDASGVYNTTGEPVEESTTKSAPVDDRPDVFIMSEKKNASEIEREQLEALKNFKIEIKMDGTDAVIEREEVKEVEDNNLTKFVEILTNSLGELTSEKLSDVLIYLNQHVEKITTMLKKYSENVPLSDDKESMEIVSTMISKISNASVAEAFNKIIRATAEEATTTEATAEEATTTEATAEEATAEEATTTEVTTTEATTEEVTTTEATTEEVTTTEVTTTEATTEEVTTTEATTEEVTTTEATTEEVTTTEAVDEPVSILLSVTTNHNSLIGDTSYWERLMAKVDAIS